MKSPRWMVATVLFAIVGAWLAYKLSLAWIAWELGVAAGPRAIIPSVIFAILVAAGVMIAMTNLASKWRVIERKNQQLQAAPPSYPDWLENIDSPGDIRLGSNPNQH